MDYVNLDRNGSSVGSVTADPVNDGSPYPSGYTWTRIAVTSVVVTVVMATIVVGNSFVIVAVFVDRRLKSPQNWFIVSLAASDLLVGVFIMPLSLANELMGYWYFGVTTCDLWLATDVLLCTASILNLCLISLDRYWSVARAADGYSQRRTRRKALAMIAVVWALSVAISLPPLFGWKRPQPAKLGYPLCVLSEEPGYVVYSTVGSFFLPLVIMALVYSRLYRTAVSRARRSLKGSSSSFTRFSSAAAAAADRKNRSLRANADLGVNFALFKLSRGSTRQYRSVPSKADRFLSAAASPDGPDRDPGEKILDHRQSPRECSVLVGDAMCNAIGKHPTTRSIGGDDAAMTSRTAPGGGVTSSNDSVVFRRRLLSNREPSMTSGRGLPRCRSGLQPVLGKAVLQVSLQGPSRTPDCLDPDLDPGPSSRAPDTSDEVDSPTGQRRSGAKKRRVVFTDKEKTSSKRRLLTESSAEATSDGGCLRRQRIVRAREKRATLVLGLVMASFVGCWLPFFATYVVVSLTGIDVVGRTTFAVIFWLGYCNSALNPVIYTVFNRDFRAAFIRIVCRMFWCL